ncbi:MAG: hypothetical protein QM757_39705 [Paludibaculum sp.]
MADLFWLRMSYPILLLVALGAVVIGLMLNNGRKGRRWAGR